MWDFHKFWNKKALTALAMGQFVSLLITSTNFSSSELARKDINIPTSQSFLNYVLLAIVFSAVLIYRNRTIQMRWWYYFLLAFVDVEANFLVVKAYQYTNMTSVMLLDAWVIPCVLLLTWIFLKTRYRFKHYFGVALCVAGSILVVFSDVHDGDREDGSNPLKGDLLVVGASTLYAISNVSEEYLVKNGGRTELMAMLGIFGAIISGVQVAILERDEIKSTHWSVGAVLAFAGFVSAMFLFYSTVPTLLKITGAAMLNLSLLTSDMWAVLIRTFAYHEKIDELYFIAFAAVVVGLVIYSSHSKGGAETRGQVGAEDTVESNVQPKDGDEEAAVGSLPRQSQDDPISKKSKDEPSSSSSSDAVIFQQRKEKLLQF